MARAISPLKLLAIAVWHRRLARVVMLASAAFLVAYMSQIAAAGQVMAASATSPVSHQMRSSSPAVRPGAWSGTGSLKASLLSSSQAITPRAGVSSSARRLSQRPTLARTNAVPVPGPVAGVKVTAQTSTSVTLSWTNPASASFTGVMIRRAAGKTPPASPTAGTLVADVAKPGTTVTNSGLQPSTTYSYALFAHNATPAYAKAAVVTTTTLTGAAPAPVTGAKASTVSSNSVTLSWANPASTQFTGVMIRRAAGKTPPASPTAGTLVADVTKPGTTVTSTGLQPSTTYSYALFAHNSVPAYAAADTLTATTTAAAPGIVHVSGTLKNNTTWSPAQASTYIIDSTVDVPKGVSLTIEPGTIVKALNDAIMVEGKLSAVGTAANPIVFTSVNDNSAGGKTGTGPPAEGDWTGITSAGAGSLDIEHASVDYTDLAVDAAGSGSLTVTGDTFSTGQGGVWADGPAAPVITGNTFTSPGGEAVGVFASGTPTVEGNSVTSPDGTAFAVDAAISPALLTGNTVSGGPSSFELAGQITASGTLPPLNVPWQVGEFNGVSESDSGACLDVPATITLTISPGTIIKGDSGGFGSLCPGNGTSAIMVEGKLSAVGTAANPIVFTSVNDNSAGGKTGTGPPAAGDWTGITVDGGSADVEYADLRYASAALSFDASLTSNDDAHNDWFDDNSMAISASSTWTTVTASVVSCFYYPTMDVSGNVYGPGQSADPIVSASDYAAIQASLLLPDTQEFPDGWADSLQKGSSDFFSWSVEPCVNVTDPGDSYFAVATPLNFSGDPIVPVGGPPAIRPRRP